MSESEEEKKKGRCWKCYTVGGICLRLIEGVFNTKGNNTIISVPFCMWWSRSFLQGVTYPIKCNMVGNLSLLITQLLTRPQQFCWPYSVFSSRKSDSSYSHFFFIFIPLSFLYTNSIRNEILIYIFKEGWKYDSILLRINKMRVVAYILRFSGFLHEKSNSTSVKKS